MKGKDNTLLIEVFTGSPWEAEITKGLLESNGIEAMVKDGIMGTLAPYISPVVSIMVNEDDYEPATEILKSQKKDKELKEEKEG